MADDCFQSIDDPEEILETAEKGNKSFLFSLLQTMKGRRGKGKEADSPAQEEDAFPEQNGASSATAAPPVPTVPQALVDCRQLWQPSAGNSPDSFLYDPAQPVTPEILLCFDTARHLLEARHARRLGLEEPLPEDALPVVCVSEDQLQAWCIILPPIDGGLDVTADAIRSGLAGCGASFGIQDELLEKLAGEKAYCKAALLARGVPPTNGEDGWVEEVIPSTVGKPFLEKDGSSIDYKNLNWIVPIKAGDVICNIHYPTRGQDGAAVTGIRLPAKSGVKAALPEGSNTGLNPENTALIAKADGQIFYENGRYKVNQMIDIDGDVDLSTGNLDVTGNLRIKGNVREGFTVRATGDINIDGMAEGATITAGRNIFVRNGMNGNGHGFMDAAGEIKCQYLENTCVRATGNVYASSIINSTVESDSEVVVTTGRGSIIGGSVSAGFRIHAKIIGNKMNHVTNLTLGATPHFRAEKRRLVDACEQAGKEVESLQNQMDALQGKTRDMSSSLMKMFQLKLAVARAKESNLQKDLEQMELKEAKFATSQINAETFYPIAHVTIGQAVRTFNTMLYHCRIYKNEGQVVNGSL